METPENRPELPPGFIYIEQFLDEQEERDLVSVFSALNFHTFEYKGFAAKRRVIAFGWTYDFNTGELSKASDIPEFLLPVRQRAAAIAEAAPDDLEEALITEYTSGAPINWHRDLPMFDKVVGISLLNSCTMKLRSYGSDHKTSSIVLQPRSLYVMYGSARRNFQHSIPPVKALRYSITFRTLRRSYRKGDG